MTAEYIAQWNRVLGDSFLPVEVVASLKESAVNHVLEKHFEYDKKKYTVIIERTFPDGMQDRKFTAILRAEAAVQIELPPFSPLDSTANSDDLLIREMFESRDGWTELPVALPHPRLYVPADPIDKRRSEKNTKLDNLPNVRVHCSAFRIELSWPHYDDNNKYWKWTPKPIVILAEAKISLNETSDEPFLRIEPTRIKFSKPEHQILREALADLKSELPANAFKVVDESEEKFYDLLVIGLNVMSTQLAPQMVRDVRVPVPVLSNKPLLPVVFDMSEKMLTVGLSLDREKIVEDAKGVIESKIERVKFLIEEEIAGKGNLEELSRKVEKASQGDSDELNSLFNMEFPRTREFVDRLAVELIPEGEKPLNRRPDVPEAVAIGVNEHLINVLAQAVVPQPASECSGWAEPPFQIPPVRGRACYWAKLTNPRIAINGTTLSGTIEVDVGGAIEGCVKKFWDCSWHWECGSLSLAIRGAPGVELNLAVSDGRGVQIRPQLIGDLAIETNLPFPFNVVIRAISWAVFWAIKAIINILLSFVTIQVVPPKLSLADQETKLQLSGFYSFSYIRPKPVKLPAGRKTFLAYTCGVTAVK